MNYPGRWRIGAMASAVALLGCLTSLEAHAVALGRITVQSALGESLRAEIDISDLNADEASSLRVGVAGADVFRAAGLEYSATASGLEVRLQRRPDGRPYLRLTSNRAISEPFVDLVLEARWASGRVTRDYTMLFDPPNLRARNNAAPVMAAPVLPREPAATSVPGARQDTQDSYTRPADRAVPTAPRPQAVRPPPAKSITGARQVTVKPGDNASRIAAQNKPASVSLDQMLVALLRGNPDAFVGGNINLIKSGAVVDIPDSQAASALSPGEARQTLIAQSRDFNTFRRKLADGVPATQLDSADRQAGGKVQTQVDDRAQAAASPDRLTLSKGAVQGLPSGQQTVTEAASRAADPSRNSSGLTPQPAQTAAPGTAPSLSVTGSSASSAPSGGPAVTATPALGTSSAAEPAGGALASTTVTKPVPEAPAPEPFPPASAPPLAASTAASQQPALTAPPATPPESGLIAQIQNNSLLLGGGIVLALLAVFGFARYRKKATSGHVDSSFLDSRLQPDSFFGASGGQRVDTNQGDAAKSSSIAYSPSQLDAAGDVDPVAEADVYLAYGRDRQAEEILKEALRTHPARLAVHSKLLEIHAKRHDIKAFEEGALAALKLTSGQGPEWTYISQLGRELEPGNSMYQSGAGFSNSLSEMQNSGLVPLSSTFPQPLAGVAPVAKTSLDLDLGLDFMPAQASSAPLAAGTPAASGSRTGPIADIAIPSAFLDLDLNLDDVPAAVPTPKNRDDLSVELPSSQFDAIANGMDFTPEPFNAPKAAIAPPAPVTTHGGMLEFDLDSLSLDLGPITKPPAEVSSGQEKDPLEIKFLLAEEFRILGDSDGAKSLADEVVAHAKGPLKIKAQAFLNTLS